MYNKAVIKTKPLSLPWETSDPFIFCMHHSDSFPRGNDSLGPAAALTGRNLGQDFSGKDGWSMYHGDTVPGFPEHPHRGFETVTVVLNGFVDHSDSVGASGRYGNGDVQWMTAGGGIQHAEMFPLLKKEEANPLNLFQIWINLPGKKKFVKSHYKMLWAESIPTVEYSDEHGKPVKVTLVAGKLENTSAPEPAPDSWAADPDNEVAIWIIKMAAGTKWILPGASQPLNRTLYFYDGSSLNIAGSNVSSNMAIELLAGQDITLENGEKDAHLVFLQGKPIGEPVAQYGPFVMNTRTEIQEAFSDYRKNQFGGWPWNRSDPVHPESKGRFAKYADGKEELPFPDEKKSTTD